MRRAIRFIFNVLSLLVLAGALILWRLSYNWTLWASWHGYGAMAEYGGIYLSGPEFGWRACGMQAIRGHPALESGIPRPVQRWKPLRWFTLPGPGDGPFTIWVVPSWVPSSAALVWVVWRARRPRKHAAADSCSNCGYDLRATPGRCPECGAGYERA